MRLLPYDSFQIETALPIEKIVERLHPCVDQHKLGWLLKSSNRDYEYLGKVNSKEFKIRRTKRYTRNAFLPLITGSFYSVDTGTLIHVEIGPRPIELLYITVWFGIVFALFVLMTFSYFNSLLQSPIPFLVPLIMLIAGGLATLATFWNEANRQKQRLLVHFQGKVADPL